MYTAVFHFVSEKFTMTVSLKGCAPVALKKDLDFRVMKKGFGQMTVHDLLKMIQKFKKAGSFDV